MTVPRFGAMWISKGNSFNGIGQMSDGPYVRSEDYDALAARLAESEAECLEQARLNGMGSEREARLIARLAEAEGKAAAYPHLMDVYNALGVRWGDNPFPIIDRLMGRATDSATPRETAP